MVRAQSSSQSQLIEICTAQLRNTLAEVVAALNGGENAKRVSFSDLPRIDQLTKMIKDFVALVEPSKRQPLISAIVMNPQNFAHCEANCIPMKIFRDVFLQGGVSFDVQSLFSAERGTEFAWLASLLLNLNNMSSLNNLPELKKQLSVFLDTEIVPAIILSASQGNKQLVFDIVHTFSQKVTDANDSCLSTLDELLQRLVDPGEQFGFDEPILKVDDFKHVFTTLGKATAQKIVD